MKRLFLVILLTGLGGASLATNWNFLKDAPIARFNSDDIAMMEKTIMKALDTVKDGGKISWKNPETGNSGLVNPVKSYKKDDKPCRSIRIVNRARNAINESLYDYCQSPDKTWEIYIKPEK